MRRAAKRKARLRLVRWNAAKAEEGAERLRRLGLDVEVAVPQGHTFI